uniref:Uncharacterized protein n=1 Tax=viral metagenome TaxID=1070528 RepID=A0A6H2A2T7_9ZZZZ
MPVDMGTVFQAVQVGVLRWTVRAAILDLDNDGCAAMGDVLGESVVYVQPPPGPVDTPIT